ncbi:MAG: ATP synthase F1 subunit epsilon [Oligoflexia bacterium]|nr:ATP synthase F1 subunit epsilon [Oligoflexia bacterium]
MDNQLKLSILSPERKLLEGCPVEEVILPTSEGQIQILSGHAAIVGTLETGVFSYREANGHHTVGFVTTGFFEVTDDSVTVTAETLELRGEIDVERAKRAQKAAEEALKAAELDSQSFRKYQLKLHRSLIRQQIAGKDHPTE